MKKLLCVLLITGYFYSFAAAQSKENKIQLKGKSNSISAGVNIPFAAFSATHNFGAGIDYSWSNHRYGRMDETPVNPVGFTVNLGADYYWGKNETIGLYTYDYSTYTFLHTYGGIIYNPGNKVNTSLTGGPTLGIYSGNTEFGLGVNLSGNYYLNKNIAITPVLIFMKESSSDPLLSGSVRATISF
jgi:hypothetical protein